MLHRSRARLVHLLVFFTVLAALPLTMVTPVVANHTVDITVRITRVVHLGGGLEEDLNEGPADLYAGVTIDGQLFDSFGIHVDDNDNITPRGWNWTKTVPLSRGWIPVSIQIWDHDDCDRPFCDDTGALESDDDQGDADPGGDDNVDLFIDPSSGEWVGDTQTGTTCLNGGFASDSVEVCWEIATSGTDDDGDGLLDVWETNGLDTNHDGVPEVDLPAMGAEPDHADLFLEIDYSPGDAPARDDIRAMKLAFAAAPWNNPDGTTGIRLWVDLGGLVDRTAVEGLPEGTCMDGFDNGLDGLQDGADPDCDGVFNTPGSGEFLDTSVEDPPPLVGGARSCGDTIDNDGVNGADGADLTCLVGDQLGGSANWGGNEVPALNNCNLDSAFYFTKTGRVGFLQVQPPNFDPDRASVFRYAISTQSRAGCGSGGQAEIGGNDFIDHNHDGGTIMHELGHTLNLHHGGDDDSNCDPNYISIMNYDHQFGIPRVRGGTIIDYSPPRINMATASRGAAPLTNLDETDLDETSAAGPVVLDVSDNQNRLVYSVMPAGSATFRKLPSNLNAAVDWNADGDTNDTGVQMNIDMPGRAPGAGGTPQPAACATHFIALLNQSVPNQATDVTDGHYDWSEVELAFVQFGDSDDSAVNPERDPLPTTEAHATLLASIHSADVGVTIADSADPAGAGERLTWTVTASNAGLAPATSVQVVTTLPTEVSFVDASVTCVQAANVISCNLGELLPYTERSFTIRADIPADLVYTNGGPKTITASATVDNLAGPDPNTANDSDSENTLVITKADVKVSSVTTTSPLEVLIGQQASATIDVTVENGGPSSPVDTQLTGTASASAGLTVAPGATTADQTALSTGTPQVVSQSFTLDCTTPGYKTVTFAYALALSLAKDPNATDPDLTNNTAQASFDIDCVVPIAINVRPKGLPNSINLNTDATLAALTTVAGEYGLPLDFDAATIDPLSVRWGVRGNVFNVGTVTGAPETHGQGHLDRSYELDEKTRDADLDMVLHFKPAASGLTVGSTEACLKGSFTASDGNTYRFLGCDSVIVRP
jgi:uncharacterized repeat protein (TIGR01451 family)